jgi:hypothetical protein
MHIVDKKDNQLDVHVVFGLFPADYLCDARFLCTLSMRGPVSCGIFVFENRCWKLTVALLICW